MDKKSGIIALILAVLLVSFNPAMFCEAEHVRCEGWVNKVFPSNE